MPRKAMWVIRVVPAALVLMLAGGVLFNVAAISKTRRVHLEIRRAGSKGMLLFTIAARVDRPKGAGLEYLRSAIKKNASALKEAYEAIANLGMAASPSPPPES